MNFEEKDFYALKSNPVWLYLTESFLNQRRALQNMLAQELSGATEKLAMDSFGAMRYMGGCISSFDFIDDLLREIVNTLRERKEESNASM